MLNLNKYLVVITVMVSFLGVLQAKQHKLSTTGVPEMVNHAVHSNPPANKIQDTHRAAQYFEEELNFKTNPHGVKSIIEAKLKNVTIVDVRDAKSYAEGHIPGAINLPYEKYNNFEGLETTFEGLRKDGYNYIYCYELLCNLAQKAAKQFAMAGYPVKEMVGGFTSWKEHNLAIEK